MANLTLLLAEDNAADEMLVAEALKESHRGTELRVVRDGEEVLLYLRRQGKYGEAPAPRLLILDLNMPRKDGREVLAEIRRDPALKDLPVVVWTGASTQREMDVTREVNPTFYFVKPDALEKFLATIKAIEEYAYSHETGKLRRLGGEAQYPPGGRA